MPPPGSPPLDARSGWATPPTAARLAGEEMYRFFGSAEEAVAFLRHLTRDAVRQRRRRARARRHEIVAPTPVGERVLDVLVNLHWLADKDADDSRKIGAAIGAMLSDLARARYG